MNHRLLTALAVIGCFTSHSLCAQNTSGWFNWRGPDQNGTSLETGLPDKIDVKDALWTADFPGQSAPVIANGRLYINGYTGDGPDLQEGVSCFDAETGKLIWQHLENDFLSDTIYLRYALSSPTIDPETGNIYVLSTHGLFSCYTADGKMLWQHSLMEEYGRLTFPNARTATPVIDQELVITRGITSGWGANGPAGDRLFAFDKKSGELVWLSSPGDRPQDNTFTPLYLSWLDGMRVIFTACGDSSVACINVRTGDPIFRFSAAKAGAKGGINAGVLRYKDSLLVTHESENVDTSEVGRTAAFKIPTGSKSPEPGKPQVYTAKELELWRNPMGTLASSPCIVGDTMYEVTGVGELAAVNVETGAVKWKKKLGAEQRQSSPFYADGKLYVAFYIAATEEGQQASAEDAGGDGELYIFKPGEKDVELLSRTKLIGRCFGSPVAYNGKVYVQTDKKLYAFGKQGDNEDVAKVVWKDQWASFKAPSVVVPARLRITPNEVLLRPGQTVATTVQALSADGFSTGGPTNIKDVKFASYVPPTALVKVKMNGAFNDKGELVADVKPVASAGAYQGVVKLGEKEVSGTMRGRVLPDFPIKYDFEGIELKEMTGPGIGKESIALPPPEPGKPFPPSGPSNWNVVEEPTAFSYPPLPWNSARFRFEIRKAPAGKGGDPASQNLALCKTIDHKLFQRAQVFIGHPDMKNYTIEADVLTEGNKRKMSDIGLINQRYLVVLRSNAGEIEVSSNLERIKEIKPFNITPNEWYRLKVRVDVANDGSGVVRAKAWKKSEPEPEVWLIEVEHEKAHSHGAPGIFSLTPQEQRAWLDNIEVTANK